MAGTPAWKPAEDELLVSTITGNHGFFLGPIPRDSDYQSKEGRGLECFGLCVQLVYIDMYLCAYTESDMYLYAYTYM